MRLNKHEAVKVIILEEFKNSYLKWYKTHVCIINVEGITNEFE